MTDLLTPTVRVTTYTVTCLPPDTPDAEAWQITVERRSRDMWAIRQRSWFLTSGGRWEVAGEREDGGWLTEHHFPLNEAIELAKRAAPHVIVSGLTPAALLTWRAQQKAAHDET
jgi:hypothetical protein